MLYFHTASWSLEISECTDCRRWVVGGLHLRSFGEVLIYAWVRLFHGAAALGLLLLLQVICLPCSLLSTVNPLASQVCPWQKCALVFPWCLITSEKPFLISARWKSSYNNFSSCVLCILLMIVWHSILHSVPQAVLSNPPASASQALGVNMGVVRNGSIFSCWKGVFKWYVKDTLLRLSLGGKCGPLSRVAHLNRFGWNKICFTFKLWLSKDLIFA